MLTVQAAGDLDTHQGRTCGANAEAIANRAQFVRPPPKTMPSLSARLRLCAGLLAGHRERSADRGEELLAVDALGLVLRHCLGPDGVLLDGLVRLHRCLGDG
jgi:hypothetical protein